ncbi:universal stress protein [Roseococcus microcysteis]|jgi:universal stress protein E|uniref:universal stress protein n=1 Tax=Roseococcus microcysteis TaxID=2771361 RepID=UPI00168BB053|nr:universal stress protein [Roseococcus microcysteis]
MRLLCATDLSSRSDRAVRRAAILAKETGAELVLLSVVDDDRPELLLASERRDVTHQLADQARGMPEMQGLNPRLRVEVGDPFDAIIRAADEEKADLVVMGEHRRRLLRDMFIGTTIERVMRLGGRPVLMVNRPSERPYRQVLAAVDISEPSASALRAATRLGFAKRGDLTVFHAFLQPGRGSMVLAGLTSEAIAGHVTATAVQARTDVSQYLRGLDVDLGPQLPPIVVHEGTPAEALKETVARLSPDLVVMGTRAHGAIGRLLLGSTAEEALRTLDCDVLAVPPDAE